MAWRLFLWCWTAISALWWGLSLHCARAGAPRRPPRKRKGSKTLSLFRPIPKIRSPQEYERLRDALFSLLSQLDSGCQLLLGIPREDACLWTDAIQLLEASECGASFQILFEPDPFPYRNPKILWQRSLAKLAKGELWVWTDGDVCLPSHFLHVVREDFEACRRGFVTYPYVIRGVDNARDFWEAAWVNVELFPGVCLLGRMDRVWFGLGAGMVFLGKKWERASLWDKLGKSLADDFVLAQTLKPGALGSVVLETFPRSLTLREALARYLRWKKTVRWCSPAGFAGQILVLPMIGWTVALFLNWHEPQNWMGWLCVVLGESLWFLSIFRAVRAHLPKRLYRLLPLWSYLRTFSWLLCWLPWPVAWDRQWWPCPVDKSSLLDQRVSLKRKGTG